MQCEIFVNAERIKGTDVYHRVHQSLLIHRPVRALNGLISRLKVYFSMEPLLM